MLAQNKPFLKNCGIILFVLGGIWLFVLSPAQNEIANFKTDCKKIQKKIQFLLQNEYPPQESILAQVKQENESVKKNLLSLRKAIHHSSNNSSLSLSPTDFRSYLEQKISSIQEKTNPLGIKFDNKLGFSSEIHSVTPEHYIHLNLAHYMILQLIDLAKDSSLNLNILDIKHSIQEKKSKEIIEPYDVNIQFESDLQTTMQFLHSVSLEQKNVDDIFFNIKRVSLRKSSENLIKADISLAALHVNLDSQSQTKSTSQDTPTDNTDPLWKRY